MCVTTPNKNKRPYIIVLLQQLQTPKQPVEGNNMNFLIWIFVGGVIGWLASIVMKTNGQQGLLLNIIVGIVGAFLGGFLLAPLFGTGTINGNDFSAPSLAISFLGSLILLAIVNLVQRRSV